MKKIFNLIIVDESGSMSSIREQALEGLNNTLSTIRSMRKEHPDIEQYVTLLTFNSEHQSFIYDNEPIDRCEKLGWNQYQPDCCTPLYDAIGKGISKVNSQCGANDNVLVTIITDGYENDSQEFSLQMIHNLISKLKEQHWTFTLIGTDNLDVEGMSKKFNIDNHLVFAENAEETRKMFRHENRSRARFCMCVADDAQLPVGSYFDDEPVEREEKKHKRH